MNPFWLSHIFPLGCFNHQPLGIHPRVPILRLPAGWPQQAAKRGVDAGNLGFPVVTRRVINQHPGAVILRSLPSPAQKKHIFLGLPKHTGSFWVDSMIFSEFLFGWDTLVSWRVLLVEDYLCYSRLIIAPWWCLFSWTSSSFSAKGSHPNIFCYGRCKNKSWGWKHKNNTKWASTIVQQTRVHKYTGHYITHFQRNQTMQIVRYFWGLSTIIVNCLGWYYI